MGWVEEDRGRGKSKDEFGRKWWKIGKMEMRERWR
jgi:hypothetical protein